MVAVAASSACAIRLHICHRYVEIDVDMQKWDFVDGVLGVVMLLGNHRANAKIDSPTFLVVTLNEFFQHGRIACGFHRPALAESFVFERADVYWPFGRFEERFEEI